MVFLFFFSARRSHSSATPLPSRPLPQLALCSHLLKLGAAALLAMPNDRRRYPDDNDDVDNSCRSAIDDDVSSSFPLSPFHGYEQHFPHHQRWPSLTPPVVASRCRRQPLFSGSSGVVVSMLSIANLPSSSRRPSSPQSRTSMLATESPTPSPDGDAAASPNVFLVRVEQKGLRLLSLSIGVLFSSLFFFSPSSRRTLFRFPPFHGYEQHFPHHQRWRRSPTRCGLPLQAAASLF